MKLNARICRLEQSSPAMQKRRVVVVARVGETIEEAEARTMAELGISDATEVDLVLVTRGPAGDR